MSIGTPDWFGTPLVQGFHTLGAQVNTGTIAANSSYSATYGFHRPGYSIAIAITGAAAMTEPFVRVALQWYDETNSYLIHEVHWFIPASTTSAYGVVGSGPVRGAVLRFRIDNLDAAQNISAIYSLAETTQHIARDDWRGPVGNQPNSALNVPQYGTATKFLPTSEASSGLLAEGVNLTLGAGVTWTILVGLFSGPVWFDFVSSQTIKVTVGYPPELFGGSTLWLDNTLTAIAIQLFLPRCPVVIGLANSGGVASSVQISANYIENAS